MTIKLDHSPTMFKCSYLKKSWLKIDCIKKKFFLNNTTELIFSIFLLSQFFVFITMFQTVNDVDPKGRIHSW